MRQLDAKRIWRCLKNEDNTRDSDTMSLHAFTANAYDDILNALVHVEVRLKSLQQVITVTSGTFGELVTSRQGQGKYRKKLCTGLFVCLVTRAKGLEIAFDRKTTCSLFMTVFFKMNNHRELTKEMSFEDWTDLISAKQEHESFRSQFDGTHIDESIANKRVNWCLNRSSAPHFGGVDESIIKSLQNVTNALLGNTDFNDVELMMDTEGLFISWLQMFQSGNYDDVIPLTAYHYLQGQIGEQFAPTSVDAAHFNPCKRGHRIQELVWHKWIHVREWLPGQPVDEMAPGTPGYTDWRGRNRDLARYMYITGSRPGDEVYTGKYGRARITEIQ